MSRMNEGAAGAFRTKRSLGQNFLIDQGVLSCIIKRAAVKPDETILEIGPGQGVLTRALLKEGCAHLHAVELDDRLKDTLQSLESQDSRLSVNWQDAMKFDYETLSPFPDKVVANIPYNITTPLIWKLLPFAVKGLHYHLYMVQKEAADRIMAEADTKERYPLGITIEVMGKASLVRNVAASCFRPAPRVDSALIEIILEKNFHLMSSDLWRRLLHSAFAQRRKTIYNNLKGFMELQNWDDILKDSSIDPKTRAEDLTGTEWLRLYNLLSSILS